MSKLGLVGRALLVAGVLLGLGVLLPAGVGADGVAGGDGGVVVPLHNDSAGVESDCPDGGGAFWHFVLAPNRGFGFVSVSLNVAGSMVDVGLSGMVLNGGQVDNVFVPVPVGASVDDLVAAGSSAVVAPGSFGGKFVLSHVCEGVTPPTTTSTTSTTTTTVPPTTTTTTVPPTTTSTTSTTTTTVPPTTTTSTTTTVPPTTTTTTTTTVPPTTTTTTVPPTTTTTTTTSPPPDVDAEAICYEIDNTGNTVQHWHEITNNSDQTFNINTLAGPVEIGPAETVTVASNSSIDEFGTDIGMTITSSTPGDACEQTVTIVKDVDGPGTPDVLYAIDVSRLVGADYETEAFIELAGGESVTFTLPSTFDPAGINYKVTETDPGGAHATSVSPDSFVLTGHRNETISVVVRNGFAAINLEKSVSSEDALPGSILTYTLVATNTGALPLSDIVIYDRLPPEVEYLDSFGDAGSCVLESAIRPQLVRCDIDATLAAGETAGAMALNVYVDPDTLPGTTVLNQAMSVGRYGDVEVEDVVAQSVNGVAGRSFPMQAFAASDLSCDPAPGEVCDLSAKIGSSVVEAANFPVFLPSPQADPVATTTRPLVVSLATPPTGSNAFPVGAVGAVFAVAGLVLVRAGRQRELRR